MTEHEKAKAMLRHPAGRDLPRCLHATATATGQVVCTKPQGHQSRHLGMVGTEPITWSHLSIVEVTR
jgi:hypothetical protein